jgi:Ca2+/H+ antiporter, TMEM165/GDT1 family
MAILNALFRCICASLSLKETKKLKRLTLNFFTAVVLVSEIGDKTFLIAALLSARHSHFKVFTGCFLALATMSVLSSFLGILLPSLLPRRYTLIAASILFFIFGQKMLKEGREIKESEKPVVEEIKKVDKEIEENKTGESWLMKFIKQGLDKISEQQNWVENLRDPIVLQAFALTFLGEWGDRSQIT